MVSIPYPQNIASYFYLPVVTPPYRRGHHNSKTIRNKTFSSENCLLKGNTLSKKILSRRDFLKAAATGGGMFALGAVPGLSGIIALAQDQITLTVGHHWDAPFKPRQDEWDAMFMEANSDIAIENIYNTWADHQTIVPTWAAAGELPDILYVHGSRAFPWASEGILLNIQSAAEADEAFNVEGIFEEALRLYRFEGELHSLPYDHGPIILGYNKTLFDELGLEYPTEEWTMDDFREAAIALSLPGQRWGYSGYYGTINMGNESGVAHLGPWGGATFNDDETGLLLESEGSRAALDFWFSLMHDDHAIPNEEERGSFTAGIYLSGLVGMFGLATWGTPEMSEFATFEWDVAPWPTGPAGRATGSFGSGFGGTRDTQNPEAVWRYLSAYLSVEGMEYMWGSSGRGSPARDAAYQSYLDSETAPEGAPYYLDALANYATTGRPYQSVTGPQVMDVINQNNSLLHTGEITVEQFIANVMEQSASVFE
jgi:multiple sugar transport system substrate-binding protein